MSNHLEAIPRPTQDVSQLQRDLDRAGYCLVADALKPQQCRALITRLEQQAEAERRKALKERDTVFTSVDNLLNKGRIFWELIVHEPVSQLIGHLLGKDYLLSLYEARAVGPGHAAQALHSDQNVIPGRTPVPFIANALWMLVDFTEENGSTRIIPGSHLWSDTHPMVQRDYATWSVFEGMFNELYDLGSTGEAQIARGARGMMNENPADTVAACAPAGSVLIFDARVIHGAGRNVTSTQQRWTILSYFCRPFMRQITNPFLSLSDEVVRELPAALRRRLGYRPWAHMGRYEDCFSWAASSHLPGSAGRTGALGGTIHVPEQSAPPQDFEEGTLT